MKRLAFLALTAVMALGVTAAVGAQTAKAKTMTMTGVVKTVAAGSLTVEKGGKDSMFAVTSSTKLLARGSTAKTKEKKAAGAAGLAITDMVHAGDQVTVKYMASGGTMTATEVRVSQK